MSELISDEAEMALIGAVLVEPEVIAELADVLPVEAFGTSKAAFCYQGMLRLWQRRAPADFGMLSAELDTMGVKDRSLLTDYLVECMQTEHGAFRYAGHLAEQVKRLAYLRAVADGGAALVRAAHGDTSAFDLEAQLSAIRVGADRFTAVSNVPVTLADQVAAVRDKTLRRWSGEYVDRVLSTGVTMLDRMFDGGFRGDDFIVVAGRPGMGKTAFGLHLAQQGRCLFCSMEMSGESVIQRLIAARAGVPFSVGRSPIGDVAMQNRWLDGSDWLEQQAFSIREDIRTTEQIEAEVRRMQADGGIDAVVVDQLDWFEDRFKDNTPQYERISALSRRSAQIMKRTGVPVIMLAQLNRDVEHRQGCIPYLSDLRDSGKIEQDATGIILLYTRSYYASRGMGGLKPDYQEDTIMGHPTWDRMNLSVVKNRQGMTGNVDAGWEGRSMTIHDVEGVAA